MRCSFTPLAEADLEEIGDYIAKDDLARALSFVRELRARCGEIAHMPKAARLRPELGSGVRVVAFGRYLICYSVRDNRVVIERVVHGARQLEDLFEPESMDSCVRVSLFKACHRLPLDNQPSLVPATNDEMGMGGRNASRAAVRRTSGANGGRRG